MGENLDEKITNAVPKLAVFGLGIYCLIQSILPSTAIAAGPELANTSAKSGYETEAPQYHSKLQLEVTKGWTPEILKKKALESEDVVILYLRHNALGPIKSGDKLTQKLADDLNGKISKFYQINCDEFNKTDGLALVKPFLAKYNDGKFKVPSWIMVNKRGSFVYTYPLSETNYQQGLYESKVLPSIFADMTTLR